MNILAKRLMKIAKMIEDDDALNRVDVPDKREVLKVGETFFDMVRYFNQSKTGVSETRPIRFKKVLLPLLGSGDFYKLEKLINSCEHFYDNNNVENYRKTLNDILHFLTDNLANRQNDSNPDKAILVKLLNLCKEAQSTFENVGMLQLPGADEEGNMDDEVDEDDSLRFEERYRDALHSGSSDPWGDANYGSEIRFSPSGRKWHRPSSENYDF